MDQGTSSPEGLQEHDRQKALLAWATASIEQFAHRQGPMDHFGQMLDWVAYFTREHFGFQQRLLNECSQQRDYLMSRVAAHCDFRRELAQLYMDSMHGDATVPERLRTLCHELMQDAQAQEQAFADIVRGSGASLKVRKTPRQRPLAQEAAKLFESPAPEPSP
ncbi:MAG: hypothetical protein PHU46_00180 [Rhodocyclaceae bacterium]|nr:hypothetical protein [Rhodocyclaceae bacterium]